MAKRRSLKSDDVGSSPTLPAMISVRLSSSAAERSAHNGEVLGSIPSRATGSVAKTEQHSPLKREIREFDSLRTHQSFARTG